MPPPTETPFPPGGDGVFAPADDGLLALLRRKLAGEPLPTAAAAHFHDADIYATDPAALTAAHRPAPPARKGEGGSWFFFTHVRPKSASDTRKSRRVGGGEGTWHSERAPRRVLDGEGNCVGHGQYFSYKSRAGSGRSCSERTDWYMVEFSDDQGADHDRVRGGEPQLVLCKIYKAHTHSRSSSGSASSSASARKRKATDDSADLASAPVMAKRRLFDSPAPVLVVTPQEELSTMARYNLAAWQENSSSTAVPGSALGSIPGTSHASSEGHADLASAPVKARRRLFDSPVPVPAVMFLTQEELSGALYNHEAWQNNSSSFTATLDSALGSEPGMTSQEKLSSEGWLDLQDNSDATEDYAFRPEPEPSQEQDKITSSKSIHSFWMPETDETMSFLTAGDVPPAPAPAYCESGALFPASWIGNDIPSPCSRGWFLGAPTFGDELGSAGAAPTVTGASNTCSMPSSAVSPATASSWWCDIWTC